MVNFSSKLNSLKACLNHHNSGTLPNQGGFSNKSCLIVYYSLNHSTEKIAEKITAGLRQTGLETTLCNIKDKTCPNPLDYDLMGIGSPVYAFQILMNVMSCLERFPDLNGKKTFAFLTHGSYMLNAGDMLKRGLLLKNAQIQGWYILSAQIIFCPTISRGVCLLMASITRRIRYRARIWSGYQKRDQ